ncbi:uncharacterized protein LOC124812767 isoform X1 [Hydra vulgaris]|uniref:uncharacterized protein LOC124812767 isoform X1 n=1 Tax=Hydra vulgaris TaxID=6087 RepID=UPI001F5FAFA5|nr:uncharacterized protein LOC124812767 isoform X4 [Hydra vulgaris]
MATYSKSVLDALTENPARLFNDFLRFLESTQPITVTSSASTITIPCVQPSAVESTQPITATFTCSTNVPSTSAIYVTSSAPSMTLPGVQPSAGWILQLAFCNVVGYDWAGRGAFGVAHVPSLMSTYTPLVYAVNISLRGC